MKNLEKKCPVSYAIDLIGGKWKLTILHTLAQNNGPMRFKELERTISGITPTMLTKQLRALEEAELVRRKIFATVPPTVEYKLSRHGVSMKAMIGEIEKWGTDQMLLKGLAPAPRIYSEKD